MKIYISGPITGTDDYYERFADKEKEMRKIFPKSDIINPVRSCAEAGLRDGEHSWKEFMNHCVYVLRGCSHIVMIPGWENSRGACVEYYLAKELELSFI
ncbi:MAG: DUF4406 domain-containing protein [Spirochaetales bacterium]|nr:DUF4406 domain-containing protein [Spirochaetales bacterium]